MQPAQRFLVNFMSLCKMMCTCGKKYCRTYMLHVHVVIFYNEGAKVGLWDQQQSCESNITHRPNKGQEQFLKIINCCQAFLTTCSIVAMSFYCVLSNVLEEYSNRCRYAYNSGRMDGSCYTYK